MSTRKIIHIDMDCFYAAIEMRDDPSLRDQPIAVGGSAEQRSVLCTSNYTARKFGVRSAMATAHAMRLCPNLIVVPVNMPKYVEVAKRIREIFFQYTDLVEPLSLDEAYLDVTNCSAFNNSATRIAQAIRDEIFAQEQLTASAGIAPNKFLAKVASECNKPNGQMVVAPSHVDEFVKQLSVKQIWGVGKVMAEKLAQANLHTCADIQQWSLIELTQQFGRMGERLYQLARGIDERPVETGRDPKSVSVERTFATDLPDLAACQAKIPELFAAFNKRWQKYQTLPIKNQFVKIKFFDFTSTTIEQCSQQINLELFSDLLVKAWQRGNIPVRLLGFGVHLQHNEESATLDLF